MAVVKVAQIATEGLVHIVPGRELRRCGGDT